ncbi:MAG: response regulator [Thermodesulfobacteriota bacterium]
MTTPFNNRILVIDDDPEILAAVCRILSPPPARGEGQVAELAALLADSAPDTPSLAAVSRRFEVETARQGEAGYRQLAAAATAGQPYAVVFVDMRMPPGWDGVRTIRAIHDADRHAQIVIVTAYADAPVSEIVARVGFTDRLLYLKKPFDPEEILQLADSLCMRWNLEEKVRGFIRLLERIVTGVGELDLSGGIERLKPSLTDLLGQFGEFLGTPDLFLAQITAGGVALRIGLGRFANGLAAEPAFAGLLERVRAQCRLKAVMQVDEFLVIPILLHACESVVVGLSPRRPVEGMDDLLTALAANVARLLDQASRASELRQEVARLRAREAQLTARLAELESRRQD